MKKDHEEDFDEDDDDVDVDVDDDMGNPNEYFNIALNIGVLINDGVIRINGRITSRLILPIIVPVGGCPNVCTNSVARNKHIKRFNRIS